MVKSESKMVIKPKEERVNVSLTVEKENGMIHNDQKLMKAMSYMAENGYWETDVRYYYYDNNNAKHWVNKIQFNAFAKAYADYKNKFTNDDVTVDEGLIEETKLQRVFKATTLRSIETWRKIKLAVSKDKVANNKGGMSVKADIVTVPFGMGATAYTKMDGVIGFDMNRDNGTITYHDQSTRFTPDEEWGAIRFCECHNGHTQSELKALVKERKALLARANNLKKNGGNKEEINHLFVEAKKLKHGISTVKADLNNVPRTSLYSNGESVYTCPICGEMWDEDDVYTSPWPAVKKESCERLSLDMMPGDTLASKRREILEACEGDEKKAEELYNLIYLDEDFKDGMGNNYITYVEDLGNDNGDDDDSAFDYKVESFRDFGDLIDKTIPWIGKSADINGIGSFITSGGEYIPGLYRNCVMTGNGHAIDSITEKYEKAYALYDELFANEDITELCYNDKIRTLNKMRDHYLALFHDADDVDGKTVFQWNRSKAINMFKSGLGHNVKFFIDENGNKRFHFGRKRKGYKYVSGSLEDLAYIDVNDSNFDNMIKERIKDIDGKWVAAYQNKQGAWILNAGINIDGKGYALAINATKNKEDASATKKWLQEVFGGQIIMANTYSNFNSYPNKTFNGYYFKVAIAKALGMGLEPTIHHNKNRWVETTGNVDMSHISSVHNVYEHTSMWRDDKPQVNQYDIVERDIAERFEVELDEATKTRRALFNKFLNDFSKRKDFLVMRSYEETNELFKEWLRNNGQDTDQ